MKLDIEYNNIAKSAIKEAFLKKVAGETLKLNGHGFLNCRNVLIGFAVVSEQEIKRLNKNYRNKNYSTDVLSFSEFKNKKEGLSAGDKVFLGEVVLCYNDIKKYAVKNNLNIKEEIARVISHGILHLLGLRHGKKMFSMQNSVAKRTK